MSQKFIAQTLVETNVERDSRRLEVTFVDTDGKRQTLSLPLTLAADLAPILKSLASAASGSGKAQFTRIPKALAVASAERERLVLIRFDDDPPYGLPIEEAEHLWRGLREETDAISQTRAPMHQ